MSKKSRKRNKKILAALALAGGAALMAKRGQGTASTNPVGGVDQIAANAAPKGNWITKKPKVIVPEIKPKIDHGMAYQSSRAAGNYPDHIPAPKRVNNVLVKSRLNADMGRNIPFHPSQGNVRKAFTMQGDTRGWNRMKKGGSVKKAKVTGIAKRGFGRALMKGKR